MSEAVLGQRLQPAVAAIAVEALARGVGGTLPTTSTLQADLGLGAGTVQRALTSLRERGALLTTSRGQLGRVVDQLDVGACWRAAGLAPVRMLLPPGGSAEIEVLADRLAGSITDLGIAHTVRHQRGGATRLRAVESGADELVAVSGATWTALADAARASVGSARFLAPGSYYAPERVVVVSRTADAGRDGRRRVAVDPESPDHVAFTEAVFGPATGTVEFVEVPFTAVPAAVLRGTVDAGVWHVTRSVIPLDLAGLTTTTVDMPALSDVWDRASGAVLVATHRRPELRAVLRSLDLGDLVAAQRRWSADHPY